MIDFQIHSIDSAPEGSKPLLTQSQKMFGSIPNLHGVLAASPQILEAYFKLHDLFTTSSLNAEELTVVWQTINVEHECHYCVPAHTIIANMMKVSPEITEALRTKQPMPTEKLQVLHETTLAVVRKRGALSEEEVQRFYAAGYEQQQLLDVILGLSMKVISNYVNRIVETPLDPTFEKYKWK